MFTQLLSSHTIRTVYTLQYALISEGNENDWLCSTAFLLSYDVYEVQCATLGREQGLYHVAMPSAQFYATRIIRRLWSAGPIDSTGEASF